MRVFLLIAFLFGSGNLFCQVIFPDFLSGTWKVSGKDNYEHWNATNGPTLRGVGYSMKNGLPSITEYLEIRKEGSTVFLIATVPNQNNGESIRFKLTQDGAKFSFENPDHDFPKKIVYDRLDQDNLQVSLSGKAAMTYTLERVNKPGSLTGDNPQYDEVLAKKLQADDYGMKYYWFVILKTGTNTTTDKAFISERFKGHMENMGKMVDVGKLVVAGPMMKNDKSYRGIFILNHPGDEKEIRELLASDPAIASDLLEAEIYKWYGSAALPMYLSASEKIWKSKH
jgi:uncharacterized protein YciI